MTDNEIIRALECCANEDLDCEDCLAHKYCDEDTFGMVQYVLDLINRQKAEIERLKADKIIAERYEKDARDLFENAVIELEAIKDYIYPLPFKTDFDMQIEKAKSEAINEFAERLCEDRVSNDPVVIAVKVELEMEGENDV